MYSFFFTNHITSVGFNDIYIVSLLKYIEILERFEMHHLENMVIAIIGKCISATFFHEKKEVPRKTKKYSHHF